MKNLFNLSTQIAGQRHRKSSIPFRLRNPLSSSRKMPAIEKNFAANKSEKTDFQSNLQVFNAVLELVLKLGALSIILGAVVAHQYLKTIDGTSLFPHLIGSQGELLSIAVGLGLVFLAIFMSLIASPLLLRSSKNWLSSNQSSDSLSFWRVFLGLAAWQIGALLAVYTDLDLIISLLLLALFAVISFVFIGTKMDWRRAWLVIPIFILAQLFAVASWPMVIEMIMQSELFDPPSANRDRYVFRLLCVWIVIYSCAVAAYVNHRNADNKERAPSYLNGLLIIFVLLLYIPLWFAPKFFVNSSMSVASFRQTQKLSTWWYVDADTYGRVSRTANSNQFLKIDGGNTYFCGYSPFMSAERIVLCPQNVEVPTLKACYVFAGLEARPAVVPEKGWSCSKG